jgi:5-methylcytosine-specific restriction endonuclease McrA
MGCFYSKEYKKQPISRTLRQEVWTAYAYNNTCPCYVCGVKLVNKGWHCSHVTAEVKGGKTELHNLRVCCAHCNTSMGDQNLYTYIHKLQEKGVEVKGPGRYNCDAYLKKHPKLVYDKRTNNWIKK